MPKEERRALIEDLDKDVDESAFDAVIANNQPQQFQQQQRQKQFVGASQQERDLTTKMESSLRMVDDDNDLDVIETVEETKKGISANDRKQGEKGRGRFVLQINMSRILVRR